MDGCKAIVALLVGAGLVTACSPSDVVDALSGGSGTGGRKVPVRELFRGGERYQFYSAPGAPVDAGGPFSPANAGIERMRMFSAIDAEDPGITLTAMVAKFDRRGAGEYWETTDDADFRKEEIAGTAVAVDQGAPAPMTLIRYRRDVVIVVAGMPPATEDDVEDLARYLLGDA